MSSASRSGVACLVLRIGVACLALAAPPGARAEPRRPAGDVLPFRILYGKPGPAPAGALACDVWVEGGRLHVRIGSDGAAHEVEGALEVAPDGVLKDVSLEAGNLRVRQPLPSVLRFDLETGPEPKELSVVFAGDVETLRIDLRVDGETVPEVVRIGERGETPEGLPAELSLTGARASWIERFGFE